VYPRSTACKMKTDFLWPLFLAPEALGFRGLKSYLFYGDKGNGKSLLMAYLTNYLVYSYVRQEKKYPQLPKRKLYSSMKFSPAVEKHTLGRYIEYWSNPRQLFDVRNADILWDEVGKDIPAAGWQDTPKELRQVFSHLRKRGNRLFANTQVYDDIDISFRRQIDRTFYMNKVCGSKDISASLPPPWVNWGLISIWEMDKRTLEKKGSMEANVDTSKKWKWQVPRFCFIEDYLIKFYDTTMEIPPYKPTTLVHTQFHCEICGKNHVEHDKM